MHNYVQLSITPHNVFCCASLSPLSLSPPAVDLDMRSLYQHAEDAEGAELLLRMLACLGAGLRTGRDFEVLQAYLCRFLLLYSDVLLSTPALAKELEALKRVHAVSCDAFRSLVQSNLCLLKVMARLPIT
jgi:U3 small nucleolar RNA-associated protein 21